MRALPPPPPVQPKETLAPISRVFEVCTPVFGGGVFIDKSKAFEKPIDKLTPVRVSAIIGQLRFWWRAIEGVRYPDLRSLREAEGRLWGTAVKPGLASVWVTGKVSTQETAQFNPNQKQEQTSGGINAYRYGVFPLENTIDRKTAGGWLTKVMGTVTLFVGLSHHATDDDRALVELAVDAWLHFGGIGGRTRRGFGALAPVRESNWRHDVEGLLRRVSARASGHSRTFHPLMPTLHHPTNTTSVTPNITHWRLKSSQMDYAGAHTHLLNQLSLFRQGPGFGRSKGQGARPGRTYWPEADEIRRHTRRQASQHSPISAARGFPRGRFGMPVITQFKDKGDGDPYNSTLTPKGRERMASPLILRPISQGSSYAALALYLYVPELDSLKLTLEHERQSFDVSILPSGDISSIRPMAQSESTTSDPIIAFLQHFKSER